MIIYIYIISTMITTLIILVILLINVFTGIDFSILRSGGVVPLPDIVSLPAIVRPGTTSTTYNPDTYSIARPRRLDSEPPNTYIVGRPRRPEIEPPNTYIVGRPRRPEIEPPNTYSIRNHRRLNTSNKYSITPRRRLYHLKPFDKNNNGYTGNIEYTNRLKNYSLENAQDGYLISDVQNMVLAYADLNSSFINTTISISKLTTADIIAPDGWVELINYISVDECPELSQSLKDIGRGLLDSDEKTVFHLFCILDVVKIDIFNFIYTKIMEDMNFTVKNGKVGLIYETSIYANIYKSIMDSLNFPEHIVKYSKIFSENPNDMKDEAHVFPTDFRFSGGFYSGFGRIEVLISMNFPYEAYYFVEQNKAPGQNDIYTDDATGTSAFFRMVDSKRVYLYTPDDSCLYDHKFGDAVLKLIYHVFKDPEYNSKNRFTFEKIDDGHLRNMYNKFSWFKIIDYDFFNTDNLPELFVALYEILNNKEKIDHNANMVEYIEKLRSDFKKNQPNQANYFDEIQIDLLNIDTASPETNNTICTHTKYSMRNKYDVIKMCTYYEQPYTYVEDDLKTNYKSRMCPVNIVIKYMNVSAYELYIPNKTNLLRVYKIFPAIDISEEGRSIETIKSIEYNFASFCKKINTKLQEYKKIYIEYTVYDNKINEMYKETFKAFVSFRLYLIVPNFGLSFYSYYDSSSRLATRLTYRDDQDRIIYNDPDGAFNPGQDDSDGYPDSYGQDDPGQDGYPDSHGQDDSDGYDSTRSNYNPYDDGPDLQYLPYDPDDHIHNPHRPMSSDDDAAV
jgi:hypothetical protein